MIRQQTTQKKSQSKTSLLNSPTSFLFTYSTINFQNVLLFLVIFLIPTQLGRHFWPSFAYIYSLKIDYYSPTVYLWDALVIIMIIFWSITKPQVNRIALTFFLIFLLSQLPSISYSQSIGASLVRFYQFLIAGIFGLYIASLDWTKMRATLFWGITVGVIFQSLIAVAEFFYRGSLGLWFLGERTFDLNTPSIATFNFFGEVFLRPYGTTPHPNVLSGFLVLMLPWIFILSKDNYLTKKVGLVSLAAGFLATILTFSRGSILVLLVEMIFFLKNFKKILLLTAIFIPFLIIRFYSAFNFDILSLQRRNDLALSAINFFESSPFFGVGLNNYIYQMSASDLISGPSRFFQPVHNIFLLILSETGLIGLLGFLILIFPFWILVYQFCFIKLRSDKVKLILGSYLIIFFLGFFDHYFLTLPTGQRLLFFIWGLSMLEYFRWKPQK